MKPEELIGKRFGRLTVVCLSHKDKWSKNYYDCVCDEWKKDFMSFYNWAMEHGYKDNLTLDRIDNNGNYCPENCRWTTSQEQSRNTRKNNLITYNGQTHCATEWEDILGFKRGILYARQKLGWSVERMMTQKSRQDHSDKRNLSASTNNRAY